MPLRGDSSFTGGAGGVGAVGCCNPPADFAAAFPATARAVEDLFMRCEAAEMGRGPPLSHTELVEGARSLSLAYTGASPARSHC